jgi:hypothetical protein
MYRGITGCVAGACALALATSGTAFARAGDRTVDETYPVATALCVKARTNTLPARLMANRSGVLAACYALENAYGPLVTTVDDAEAAYLATVAAQRSLAATACTRPVANVTTCQAARTTRRTSDTTALTTRRSAVDSYHASVEATRTTFWTTVQGLRSTSS